ELVVARAGGADDVRAAGFGDLYGQVTNAAGRGVDEHALAGLDTGGVDEGLPPGQPRPRPGGPPRQAPPTTPWARGPPPAPRRPAPDRRRTRREPRPRTGRAASGSPRPPA